MPSSARVYARLQNLLRRSVFDVSDVVELVCVDAGLAAGVVRLGNSVHFCHGSPVESVHEAINRVGIREINRIVGQTVTGQLFMGKLPLYRIDGEALSQNSLATALAMSFLAKASNEDERAAYTLGLLRPVGRLALQRLATTSVIIPPPALPETGNAAAAEAWERNTFGVSNVEMLALLMAEWGFEPMLCLAAKHHLLPGTDARHNRLSALLHVACWTAETMDKGLPGEKGAWSLDDAILELAGLRENMPHECVLETRTELNRLVAMSPRQAVA
jgi:HD-like signal output (HDOD) protein